MKRKIMSKPLAFSLSLVIVGLTVISCVNKSAPIEIQPQLKQLEVLYRIQELQRTTIAIHDANPTLLSKTKADLVVKFTLATTDLVGSETGWQSKVKVLWTTLKKEFTPPANLIPIWTIVDGLIQGLL